MNFPFFAEPWVCPIINRICSRHQRSARFIAVSVALLCFVSARGAAQGWDKQKNVSPSVIVAPGTPHAWTMEQAHYLLERNRAHDMGLGETDPGSLNPNDVVGFRLDALRSLFSLSVQYDQSIGLKNKLGMQQFNQQLSLRNQLLGQQQSILAAQTDLAFHLAKAQAELSVLKAATPIDQAKIDLKNIEITRLTGESSALSTQMSAVMAATPAAPSAPDLASAVPSDALSSSILGTGNTTFDTLVKNFNPGPTSSKLSAQQMLNNYVDFQYEMVAKQLTLLRDEAGPTNRVLFLELPHSIYVTSKFHPYPYFGGLWGDHLVQAWWKVDGGLMVSQRCPNADKYGAHRAPTTRELETLSEELQPSKANRTLPETATVQNRQLCDEDLRLYESSYKDEVDAAEKVKEKAEAALRAAKSDVQKAEVLSSLEEVNVAARKKVTEAATEEVEKAKAAKKTPAIASATKKLVAANDSEKKAKAKAATAGAALLAAQNSLDTSAKAVKQSITQLDSLEKKQQNVHLTYANYEGLVEFYPNHVTTDAKTSANGGKAINGVRVYEAPLPLESPVEGDSKKEKYDIWKANWEYSSVLHQQGTPGSKYAPIYTLDLIPRQDALNIAEASSVEHQTGIAGVFSALIGFGAKARYERQHQQLSQYTQTEQFGSAFGKGDYRFGWTFSKKPGTKQVDSGLRTTYVVLVVPRDTRIVRLKAIGCGYRRRNPPIDPFSFEPSESSEILTSEGGSASTPNGQPVPYDHQYKLNSEDCSGIRTFDIEVPDSDDNFWVDSAKYVPVPAGQRTTLTLTGRFGDQVGVLVNGTPLQKVPSLSQPGMTQSVFKFEPNAGDNGIAGVFELIHNRSSDEDKGSNIVASFIMPSTFVGTPKVTLVSAARQALLTDKRTETPPLEPIRGATQHMMFYVQPKITRVDTAYGEDGKVRLAVVGQGFDTESTSTVVVAGKPFGPQDPGLAAMSSKYSMSAQSALLTVEVDRKSISPKGTVDYISWDGDVPQDAPYTVTDDGPPEKPVCSGTLGAAKDGKATATLTLKGSFFLVGGTVALKTAPKADTDPTLTGTSYVSDSEWDLTASVPAGTTSLAITVKQGAMSSARQISCTIKLPTSTQVAHVARAAAAAAPSPAAPASTQR